MILCQRTILREAWGCSGDKYECSMSHFGFWTLGSKLKGPGEQGAAGYCPKILLLKRGQNGALSLP